MSYKNCLQELLQKNGCKLPNYVLEDSAGPSHDLNFKFSVSATWRDGNIYTEMGSGRSKRDAQQEAAKKLLNILSSENGTSKGPSPYCTPPRVSSSTDRCDDKSPWKVLSSPSQMKSELQQVLQRNGLPIPQYVLQRQSGPAHEPKFTVKLEILSAEMKIIWEALGVGRTKQSAEVSAAEKGLQYVNDIVAKEGDLFTLMMKKPKAPVRQGVDPSVDADLNSQVPNDTETVFIQSDKDEGGRITWLCMKMVKHENLKTTVASHGEGMTKDEAERQANFNLIHSIHALNSM